MFYLKVLRLWFLVLLFSDKFYLERREKPRVRPLCSPGLVYFHICVGFRTNGRSPSLILSRSDGALPGSSTPPVQQVSTLPAAPPKPNTGPGAAFLQRAGFHSDCDGTELTMDIKPLSIHFQQFCWRMKTRIQIYQNTIAIFATKTHSLHETILSFHVVKRRNSLL